MTLVPGTRVGVYDIDSLLGVGEMGDVYEARDTRLQPLAPLVDVEAVAREPAVAALPAGR